MRHYWKDSGALVLCPDDDDECDDLVDWFEDYQGNPELLEVETDDQPRRGRRPMNSQSYDGGRSSQGGRGRDSRSGRDRGGYQSQGRRNQRRSQYNDRDDSGSSSRGGDGSRRRDGDES